MARKTNLDGLIHCDSCGEDYSATYKRCPFCGGRQSDTAPVRQDPDDEDDGYVFDGQDAFDDIPEVTSASRSKGGKRLAGSGGRRSGGSSAGRGAPPPPINWPRLITFLCSLVIIVAALIIVFTVIYPQLHKDPTPNTSSAPTGEPSVPPSELPSQDPANPSADPAVSGEPSSPPASVTGLTLDTYDFTLWPGQSHTLKVTVEPADWDGEITFTSSDTSYATVDSNGTVTHVNTSTSLKRVIITVTAGGQSVECTVYCRGVGTSESAPPVVTTPAPGASQPPSGGLTAGAQGTIVNAAGGLRVRSGPGTGYSVLASLVNGSKVTIVSNAGDGWYEITFAGSGGAATTGYIMGEYISVP